jgi:hypothetical protein
MKTSELKGAALDWAVAKCEGYDWMNGNAVHPRNGLPCGVIPFSTNWAQGGPIIEREGISLIRQTPDRWVSEYSNGCDRFDHARSHGPTPLIAAMRCYVASKLGDDVDVPEELQ